MKMPKQILVAFFIISLSIFLFNCKTDDEKESFPLEGNTLSMTDIAGSWTATFAMFSTTATNPPTAVHIIDEGGNVTLVIQTNGKFTFTISFPGESADITVGQLGFDEDYLVVMYDDDPEDYEYMGIQLSDDHNHLFISGPSSYDFDDDGVEEPAQLSLELLRDNAL